MDGFYSLIYKGFIGAALIAFIIGFLTTSNISLGAYIAGYSVLILAVLMILIIMFNDIAKISDSSIFQTISSIMMIAGPFILLLCVISFILYMLIKYKNKIIDGQVATSYNSFSNVLVLLIMLQLYMIYTNIGNEKFNSTGKMSKVTSSIIYLIGVLTGICSIILYTILKYYSTDGFSSMSF